ncbi:hypothetical protein VKT23_007787 [Stygiomarasmius scandens]|uniref:Uncharacterized protein n=1 Tax=Marasmiellus scandens TaxID=2682957 RepID=A0ABR1JIE0_9AGAR
MRIWYWSLFIRALLVRTLQLEAPATAAIGETVSVTWILDASDNSPLKFGIGIPLNDDTNINQNEIKTIDTNGENHGTIDFLVAIPTPRSVHFEAYSLPDLKPMFGSSPMLVQSQEISSSTIPRNPFTTSSHEASSSANVPSHTFSSDIPGTVTQNIPGSTVKTSPNGDSQPNRQPNHLQIILAVVFGVLCVVIVILFLIFLLLKRRKRLQKADTEETPNSSLSEWSLPENPGSTWDDSSLGPSDSISQTNIPLSQKRRVLLPSTALTYCSEETESLGTFSISETQHDMIARPSLVRFGTQSERSII